MRDLASETRKPIRAKFKKNINPDLYASKHAPMAEKAGTAFSYFTLFPALVKRHLAENEPLARIRTTVR
jgi:hypothetical protein